MAEPDAPDREAIATDGGGAVTDPFSARPIKEVIRNIAIGIAESQEELDRRSMATQREIERAVERGELDYEIDASWLRFADVDVDLELLVSLEGKAETDDAGRTAYRPRIAIAPVGPRLKTEYEVEADMTSTISLRIAPVPPERRRS